MIAGIVARARSLRRGLLRRRDVELDMAEEFRLHIEMRAEDLERAGWPPAEALRRARIEFGSTERFKDEARQSRGLGPFDALHVSLLDVKLGGRMLVRYPGLALVGGVAMAFAIAVGAAGFEVITQIAAPTLPLPQGERIVAIRAWDAAAGDQERHLAHELIAWRGALRSVEELGAHRTVRRNLIVPGGEVSPVSVAEISASAFRVADVPPLLGRRLAAADERPDAAPALLVGYDAWRTRFAADSSVVGRVVQLDGAPYTVVGVMPEGFAFPASHSWWVPLRLGAPDYPPGEGPELELFGRLAPGATLDAARAELAALGRREATDFPEARARVRPEAIPFGESLFGARMGMGLRAALRAANLPFLLFLVLVCGNVAMLMFARAATRENEIVVRTALGASRGRIVMQLFAEALVLGAVAAAIGLAGAHFILRIGMAAADGPTGALPFWIHPTLSPVTVLYVVALTTLGAAIAGVVPALKVTRGMAARLRSATAGGGGGLRFGGIWTAVIVCQIAVTVAFPIVALAAWRSTVRQRALETTFRAREFLMVSLAMDPASDLAHTADSAALRARLSGARAELERRIVAEPGVLGVTAGSTLPLMYHPWRRVEVEGVTAADTGAAAPRVSGVRVADDFFTVFGTPILAGRAFQPGDVAGGERVAIVNQSFVREVLGGRNPIGRRVRYTAFEERAADARRADAGPEPWYEIVGVVPDLGMKAAGDARLAAGLYHPAPRGAEDVAYLAVHVRGDAAAQASKLRTLAAAVDPTLRLDEVLPMSQIQAGDLRMEGYIFDVLVVVSGLALILSLAGVYAVTSFVVARRTREIGIRVALGADPRRVVATIVRRPLTQVALGVALGCGLLALLQSTSANGLSLSAAGVFAAYGAGVFVVCLLACVVPTRRALRVQPTVALQAEG